jgi:RNA polymerase sigma factor (sigma-70 family)
MTATMTQGAGAPPQLGNRAQPSRSWQDKRLVQECLRGNDEAWVALVDKYKHLVHSIAVKYGAGTEDAADLFQAVWLDVYSELSNLRKQNSLRSWLISLTLHKCYHWKQKQQRLNSRESAVYEEELTDGSPAVAVSVEEVERDQLIREAIAQLPPRCQELIRMLFYASPALPYRQIAERLGLATGSIGFIRGRCLKRLQQILEKQGVP